MTEAELRDLLETSLAVIEQLAETVDAHAQFSEGVIKAVNQNYGTEVDMSATIVAALAVAYKGREFAVKARGRLDE